MKLATSILPDDWLFDCLGIVYDNYYMFHKTVPVYIEQKMIWELYFSKKNSFTYSGVMTEKRILTGHVT